MVMRHGLVLLDVPLVSSEKRTYNGLPDLMTEVARQELANLSEDILECNVIYLPQVWRGRVPVGCVEGVPVGCVEGCTCWVCGGVYLLGVWRVYLLGVWRVYLLGVWRVYLLGVWRGVVYCTYIWCTS